MSPWEDVKSALQRPRGWDCTTRAVFSETGFPEKVFPGYGERTGAGSHSGEAGMCGNQQAPGAQANAGSGDPSEKAP